jgi:hypothetical protein
METQKWTGSEMARSSPTPAFLEFPYLMATVTRHNRSPEATRLRADSSHPMAFPGKHIGLDTSPHNGTFTKRTIQIPGCDTPGHLHELWFSIESTNIFTMDFLCPDQPRG